MSTAAKRLMELFEGFRTAHGTHGTPQRDPDGLKWAIKKTAKTVREPVTEELWDLHLNGKKPLGVIPINEENLCRWGSIDYDVYDSDLLKIVADVEKQKLPLVPGRSKSGGLHLWLFLKEPQPAESVQAALRELAAMIGLAESEIFPKQTRILTDRGDLGNWMVMPYYGDTYGGKIKSQVGLKKTGAEMTVTEFINAAERTKVTLEQLNEFKAKRLSTSGSGKKGGGEETKRQQREFSDGPPCLMFLAAKGVPQGQQNNTLFHMGIYYKQKDPEGWQKRLEEANHKFMKPPLPSDQVQSTIRSLEKKEYEYTCKTQPMASHCDSVVCRTKKFGVGRGGEYPIIAGLSKLDTEPSIWFVDVEEARLELSTDELQNYHKFHKACMDKVHKSFRMIPQAAWLLLVSDAMANMTLVPAPPDVGVAGHFREIMEEYLTNRAKGEKKEDLLNNRPWENEEEGRYYFALTHFMTFMKRAGLELKRPEVQQLITKMGGGHHFFNIKGKGINTRFLPSSVVQRTPPTEPPKLKGSPI